MTLIEMRDEAIRRGIESVRAHEKGPRLAGGLEGLERCRDLLTLADYGKELHERYERELAMMNGCYGQPDDAAADEYWRYRYATLQIEWMYELCRVALRQSPVTARAVMLYAEIVGIRGERPASPEAGA